MAEVIGFKIELPGSEKLTVVLKEQRELKQEIAATRKELKTKGLGAEEYAKLDKKLFELTATQKTLNKETTQSRNAFIAAGKTGAGAYDRLSSSLRVLRTQSKNAQAEVLELTSDLDKLQKEGQQNTDEFKDLEKQLIKAKTAMLQLSPAVDKLDKELKQIDARNGQFQRNVGNYPKILQGAAKSLNGLGISLPDISKGALLAGGAIAGITLAAEGLKVVGQYVADTVVEFQGLRKEVSFLTGTTGGELDGLTSRIKAISETFGTDFNEVLKAANAEAKQTGISVSDSLDAIETRFLAGADSSGELLDSIKEYSPFIKEAGLSTEQFTNILANSSDQGIFGDKGIDAVKEAVLRIRELPEATEIAINKLGISTKEIEEIIAKNGIGGVIAKVSEEINKLPDDSAIAGEAVAAIFGGAGEDAGIKYIKSLQNINEEQSSLIDTSNKYTQQQQAQLEIQNRLAEAQLKLSNSFGDSNITLGLLSDSLKGEFTLILVDIIEATKELFDLLSPIAPLLKTIGLQSGDTASNVKVLSSIIRIGLVGGLEVAVKIVRVAAGFFNELRDTIARVTTASEGFSLKAITEQFTGFFRRVGVRTDIINEQTKKSSNLAKTLNERIKARVDLLKQQANANKKTIDTNNKSAKSQKEATKEVEAATNSIQALSKVVSDLQKDLQTNDDPEFLQKTNDELKIAQQNLAKAQNLLDTIQGKTIELKPISQIELSSEDLDLSKLEGEIDLNKVIELTPLQVQTDFEAELNKIENERQAAILDSATTTAEQVNEINRNAELQRLQAQLDLLNLEKEERIRIEEEITAVKDAQRAAEREKTFEEINFALESVQTGIDVINQLFDARLEKNLSTLEKQRANELQGVAEGSAQEETINKKFDKKKEQLEKKAFERNKKLSISQALINGALAITRILADVPKVDFGVSTAILTGLAIATTAGQVAAISATEFADGGRVGVGNIPRKPNGDNVLATLKTGEVVLNETQQQRMERLTGRSMTDISKSIGIPGFASGGVVGGSLAPSGLIEQQVRQQTIIVNIDSELIGKEIANKVKAELKNIEGVGNIVEEIIDSNNELEDKVDELISLGTKALNNK